MRSLPAGASSERFDVHVVARRVLLVVCALASLADYILAVLSPGPSAASALLVPLSFISTVAAAYAYGMWVGIATAGAIGIAGAVLPDPALGLPYVVLQIVLGGLIGRVRDLTIAARARENQYAMRERHFKALAENSTDLVLVIGDDGKATFASPSFAPLLGRLPDAMLGLGYYDVFGHAAALAVENLQRAREGAPSRFEISGRHADGSTRVLDATARDLREDPAVAGFVVNARDVTDRRSAETQLAEQSLKDALTALPNRPALAARAAEAIASAARDGLRCALLLLDLDRFKDVNDVLGHGAGDGLLGEVAARLRNGVRDIDFVGRIGGDEFVVLLPRIVENAEALEIADRLRAVVARPYNVAARQLVIGASVGIAYSDSTCDADTLLRRADVAMHAAKRNRRGIAVFSKNEDERAARRLSMAGALQGAIAHDQLVLHYQPQIDLRTGVVRGVEALVRWQHPDRGLLYPDYFLPIAEEIGETDRLTEWVLRTAVRQARRWNRAGRKLRVSVNLSAGDLRDDRLSESIPRLLSNYGLPPDELCLELTETTVMTEADSAAKTLTALSAAGVRISIDDFGTGYSAIAHLKAFPVDELKIDKQFVLNMDDDADDAAIVASTIELAHRLGVDVVVEGVERTSTLAELRRMGAEYAQGYAIGRPLAADAFEHWLTDHRHKAASEA